MSSNSHALKASRLFDVSGWVAVVTGGGTGIGLMAAQALAANGAKVYIVGRRKDALERAAQTHGTAEALGNSGGSLIPLVGDETSKDSIEAFVKEIASKEKQVDVLVNNAGVNSPTREVEKGDESAQALSDELWQDTFQDWEKTYATNVTGYYFTSVKMLPLLAAASANKKGQSASIINIASISGITRTTQHHFGYNVSKAATIQLNNLMAHEFCRPAVKVRVNCIAPGIFPSEMTTSESGDDQKSYIPAKGYRENKGIPAGRPGKDEDMAQAVLHFAVNDYANGTTITVDGGYLLAKP